MSEQPDYFMLLGLEKTYLLDEAVLEQAYLAAQRQHHPDRFARAEEADRLVAIQHSADINQAYHTLKNPVKRAEYLLAQADHPVEKATASQALLMESMEQREALMGADSENATEVLAAKAEKNITDCMEVFALAWQQQQWDEAVQLALRMRYTQKFMQEISSRRKMLA